MGSFLRLRCLPGWFFLPCLLAFLGAAGAGRALFAGPPPKPSGQGAGKKPDILIIFHAYDTKGRELSGAWLTGPSGQVPRQPVTGSDCQLTRPEGSRTDLIFEYRGRTRTESVTWRPTSDYLTWAESALPAKLEKLDPGYDKQRWSGVIRTRIKDRATSTKYDYPVVFRAAR